MKSKCSPPEIRQQEPTFHLPGSLRFKVSAEISGKSGSYHGGRPPAAMGSLLGIVGSYVMPTLPLVGRGHQHETPTRMLKSRRDLRAAHALLCGSNLY